MAKSDNILNEPSVAYNATDDINMFRIIDAVRQGIPYRHFDSLARSGPFSFSEWSLFLSLSERTLQRYKKEKKTFEKPQSEKIIEIVMLYKYGSTVFGSGRKFDEWLSAPNLALGKKMPKEFLDSTFGISMVRDELTRIEHGILA